MEQPTPILRVTVGAPVYTSDEARIGSVKEVRGNALEVETGIFSRNFWLPSDVIEDAFPEEAVMLTVAQDELNDWKREEPAAA
jgi:hypothetical protein